MRLLRLLALWSYSVQCPETDHTDVCRKKMEFTQEFEGNPEEMPKRFLE